MGRGRSQVCFRMNFMLSSRQRRAIRLASRFIAPYRWQALGHCWRWW
ncbi:Lipid A export ATP-binding/permease protein MsbA [Pseudomonas chlororaphis subsp. aurantiaca]|nr:Lipid A export ATP-binding/permease protein MsbA [Pseudomonas chlororaphis subsp. aurantiaca]